LATIKQAANDRKHAILVMIVSIALYNPFRQRCEAFIPGNWRRFSRSWRRKTSGISGKRPNSCESGYKECFTALPFRVDVRFFFLTLMPHSAAGGHSAGFN
jgi:hypothetical protein